MAKQDLIRYEEYRRRDFYQNNQIGIRLKHIEAMAKVIDCVDLYCNHVLKYPPNIKGKRLENYKNGRRLGIDLSLGPNNLALNHTQETILLIAKRISKDNIFTVAELTDCLPELKKLCPTSYNGQRPKKSLSSNVNQLVKKGKLIKLGNGRYEVVMERPVVDDSS